MFRLDRVKNKLMKELQLGKTDMSIIETDKEIGVIELFVPGSGPGRDIMTIDGNTNLYSLMNWKSKTCLDALDIILKEFPEMRYLNKELAEGWNIPELLDFEKISFETSPSRSIAYAYIDTGNNFDIIMFIPTTSGNIELQRFDIEVLEDRKLREEMITLFRGLEATGLNIDASRYANVSIYDYLIWEDMS